MMDMSLTTLTDELLFLSIKDGDTNAFRVLVDKYCTALLAHSVHYVRRHDIAEEIVSDVFLAFWEKRERIEISHSFRSYLYSSVRNHSINYLRAQKKHLPFELVPDETFPEPDVDTSEAESREHMTLLAGQLEEMLHLLPPQRRKIFMLYREGHKHKEIASMLNLSEKTVRNNMERAVKKLKDALQVVKKAGLLIALACQSLSQNGWGPGG